MMAYLYLAIAIVAEVAATSALKSSEQFSKPFPTAVVVIGYGIAFYLLTLVLRSLPVGITYAIWSGLGIVLVTLVAAFLYKQTPDLGGILGMALIVAGVVVINLFSNMAVH